MLELWSVVQRVPAAARASDRERDGPRRPRAAGGREAAVFERIEAFRRRKPRLLDDVVTLAHGAGGQGVGGPARGRVPPRVRRRRARRLRPTPPCSTLPSGERLAFSTDSYVVQPLRFPAASVGHLAVHGTINDLAMMGARPLGLVRRVRARGGIPDRRAARRSSPTWPRPPPTRASTSSRATPRSSIGAPPTACTSRPPASG